MLRILVVTDAVTASTHTAVLQPFDFLASIGRITYNLVSTDEVIEPSTVISHDLVVIQRAIHPSILQLLAWTRKYGIGLIYDLDDNFFAIDDNDHPPGSHFNRPVVKQVVDRMVRKADLVRVGSSQLAEALAPYTSRIEFRRNSVDLGYIDSLGPRPLGSNPLIIGYCGTPKLNDFQFVIPAILRLLSEYPNGLRFDFLGFIPNELVSHPGVTFAPYDFDYRNFLRTWWGRGWHVGLAPLRNSLFNNSKTDIKFREYGAMRVAGIYSNLPNYREVVQDGVSGILVNNDPASWYSAIKKLMDDEQFRNLVVNHARYAVEQCHPISKIATEWWALLQQYFSAD
jgi:glycosyltransferase involved in cell wall biosynthesis